MQAYNSGGRNIKNWWQSSEPHKEAWQCFSFIYERDGDRRELIKRNMRLYGNQDILGFGPTSANTLRTSDRITLNVIKSAVDTVTARIGKQRPRPRFLTDAGNWSFKRKAKLLERWSDAQYYNTKLYKIAPQVFLDCAVFGTGAVKVYSYGTTICVERVFPGELFVDQAEGLYQDPRQIFQRKFIPRDVLLGLYPEHGAAIKAAAPVSVKDEEDQDFGVDTLADQIPVLECWHLPSYAGAEDGKHLISIRDKTLKVEPYYYDCFPISVIRWSERLRGFWGMGLSEEITGIQIEINRLLQKIQKSTHLMAVPQIWVENNSKVKVSQLSNQMGAVYHYQGQKPVYMVPPAMSPEVYQHLWQLYQRAFEIAGVSGLSAASIKPSGLDSAPALREYHDIETERFALRSLAYEQMFMEITNLFIEEGRSIHRRDPSYKVVTQKDKYTIQEVNWEDVDMEKDSYVLKIFPASSLPSTPPGRLAYVQDLLQMGLISPEQGTALLDFPDLQEASDLGQSVKNNISRVIEKMLDTGVYESPEPFIDLNMALIMVQDAYNKAVQDGVPEDRLSLLREYLASVHLMQQRAMTQMPIGSPQMDIPPGTDALGANPMAPPGPVIQ